MPRVFVQAASPLSLGRIADRCSSPCDGTCPMCSVTCPGWHQGAPLCSSSCDGLCPMCSAVTCPSNATRQAGLPSSVSRPILPDSICFSRSRCASALSAALLAATSWSLSLSFSLSNVVEGRTGPDACSCCCACA
eukprot:1143013-Pelagomonas_calceolata.AAC.4